MAKPNNEKVTGIAIGQGRGNGNSKSNAGNVPSNVPSSWVPSTPVGSSAPPPAVAKPSFLAQLLGTVCTCCVPLLLVLFFVSAFLTSSKKKNR